MRILLGLVMAGALAVLAAPGAAATLASYAAPGAPTAPGRDGAWPLAPRPPVVRGFDPPATAYGRGHRGVDLLGRPGQVVRAALAGRVAFAAVLAGRGVVVVDHGTVRTTYEPVSASVQVGEVVGRGAPLGALVARGGHCFPRACLHWGLLRGDTYLDPLTLVGAGPVRLLPLEPYAGPVRSVGPVARWLPTAPLALITVGRTHPAGATGPLRSGSLRAV